MSRFSMLVLTAAALMAPAIAMAASITGVAVEATGGQERIVFTTDQSVPVEKRFLLPNPDRVVIDIPTVAATGIVLPVGYKGGLIGNIRFGQFDPDTSRLVIDLRAPATLVRAEAETPNRLVVELAPKGSVSAPAPKPTAAAPASMPATASSPFAVMEAAPTPAPVKETKKPLIVLDPGHGGQDPGAIGAKKTREKDVTLAMAKHLREQLLRTGRYRVVLTRDNDTYIPLQGRVDIARKANADVFISLHADSNPRPDARGLSVYTLSETASDDEAAALAEQENKSDIIAGLDLNTADEDVASILIDLTQRETMNKSAILADTIVETLHPKVIKLTSTHRFAGFRVLKAPDVPSVLIELGFLSNAQDERLLQSKEYDDVVGVSLIKALDRFTAE